MKNKSLLLCLLFIFIGFTTLFGQKAVWDIYTIDDQPYYRVVLDTMQNDSLFVKSMGNTYGLPLKSIRILKRQRKSRAGIGFIGGMVLGGVAMYLYNKNTTSSHSAFPIDLRDLNRGFSTFMGMISGGVLGYVVGAGLGTDEYYDFEKYSPDQQKEILQFILNKNH